MTTPPSTMSAPPAAASSIARDLLDFIDLSPSPWHAVATACERLLAAGFSPLAETDRWTLAPGDRHFVVRGGSSLVAFVVGQRPPARTGLALIGAHTDSPGLRIKPCPADRTGGFNRLAVEVYGGPLLATFADRDLGLAGRVIVRTASGPASRLVHFDRPLLRLPNLAIHMNREANESGLKFNKQTELPPLFGRSGDLPPEQVFCRLLGEAAEAAADDILGWDIGVCDTQKGAFWGVDREFIAASRIDNLASCHAALGALLAVNNPAATCLVGLFDHEEVGSESATGAAGSFLPDVVTRLALARGLDREDEARMRARSFMVSADMAHAWHPNFPAAYEPGHPVLINGGPAIKINANQRYGTNGETAARFRAACDAAGVPCQSYAHRTDLGCGSTIGPLVAARLGVATVDVGNPMWAMHSLRESAGVTDHASLIAALARVLADHA